MLRIQLTLGRARMRRIAAIIAAASVLALGACSTLPAGLDGNLTNTWSSMPAPTASLPIVGDCYNSTNPDMQENTPLPCASVHEIEVVSVGEFTGSDATATEPPASGSSAIQAAYATCDSNATSYLGGDFHGGLLGLDAVTPDRDAWQGGARWYGCEAYEIEGISNSNPVDVNVSLKGVLNHAEPLKLSCVTWTNTEGYLDDFLAASCAKPHTGEYVGVYDAPPLPFPSEKTFDAIAGDGCSGVLARFLGLPSDSSYSPTIGEAWLYIDSDDWDQGDHEIRCFANAYTHDRKFIGSVKGIGHRAAKG
jgi:putative regulator of septum formation